MLMGPALGPHQLQDMADRRASLLRPASPDVPSPTPAASPNRSRDPRFNGGLVRFCLPSALLAELQLGDRRNRAVSPVGDGALHGAEVPMEQRNAIHEWERGARHERRCNPSPNFSLGANRYNSHNNDKQTKHK